MGLNRVVDEGKCDGCDECKIVCPIVCGCVWDCTFCEECADVCPVEAITFEYKKDVIDDFMNRFTSTFDKLCGVHDPYQIFRDFLDMGISQFSVDKTHNHNYNYTQEEFKLFEKLFKEWIFGMQKKLETNKWFDWFGDFYQDIILSKYKAGNTGQFFTPSEISDLMTKITIQENYNPIGKMINDDCCGSGRNLLSYHGEYQGSILIGADLDELCCKMTVLNFLIHGVVGSVLWQNSLSNEFFCGWKVNELLNYGLPVPHVKKVDSKDYLFNFIGRDNVSLNNMTFKEGGSI